MPLIKDEERIFLVQIKNSSKLENAIVREVVIWCLANVILQRREKERNDWRVFENVE